MRNPTTVFLITAVAACTDAGMAQDTPPTDNAGEPAVSQVANYEVPVDAPSPHALFAIGGVKFRQRDGAIRLQYDLPLELTGLPIVEIDLEGSAAAAEGVWHLAGKDGTANCSAKGDGYSCTLGYENLVTDMDKVQAYLDATYPSQAMDRLQVAQVFHDDPIGILHIDELQVRDEKSGAQEH